MIPAKSGLSKERIGPLVLLCSKRFVSTAQFGGVEKCFQDPSRHRLIVENKNGSE
jgi:hypothetical protein